MQNNLELSSLIESIKTRSVDQLTFFPNSVLAFGINSDGTVIIGVNTSAGSTSHAFRWKYGEGMRDLGVLPDRTAGSTALGVNANGTVIVGNSWNDRQEHRAFRWKENTGTMEDLGVLPSRVNSNARGLSDDGTVIVGDSWNDIGERRAFRWDANSGMRDLGVLPDRTRSSAQAVSADGTTVMGTCIGGGVTRAFRWKDGRTPAMEDLGVLSSMTSSQGHSMSIDGTVIVGDSWNDIGERRAFRWDANSGMRDLGVPPDRTRSSARAVNADGTVIVGNIWNDNDPGSGRGFRWRNDVPVMHDLGEYNTGMGSNANGLSSDGSVIVGGEVCQGPGAKSPHALRWTAYCGMQDLRVLGGFERSNAYGVSANGFAAFGICWKGEGGAVRAFRWAAGVLQNLGSLPDL